MNKLITITSSIGVLFCLPITMILFFYPHLLKEFSRDYLNDRLAPKANQAAEEVIATGIPILHRYHAPEEMITFVVLHARTCTENPYAYVSNITSEESTQRFKEFAIQNPFLSKVIPKNLFFYQLIKGHFIKSYQKLLNDLRIFFCTTLIGLSFCLYVQLKQTKNRPTNLPSYVMLISLAYSTSTYIDQSFFFNFLLNTHMGIWYPVLLLITFTKIMLKRGRQNLKEEISETLQETLENTLS